MIFFPDVWYSCHDKFVNVWCEHAHHFPVKSHYLFFYDCCVIPLRFWVVAKADSATSAVFFFFCQTATGILAQTLVTTDSIDWPFKPAAHIRSDILIHMRNWNDTAQTQACLCLLMLPMFWLKKKGKTRSECLESFERKRAWTTHSSMQVSSHHYNMMVMLI